MLLVLLSWLFHFIRVGLLVFIVHDVSDVFLELAKLFGYFHKQRVCNALFASFAISTEAAGTRRCAVSADRDTRSCRGPVFGVTRLWIFPSRIIYTTLVESTIVLRPSAPPGPWYLFNALLLSLQVGRIGACHPVPLGLHPDPRCARR